MYSIQYKIVHFYIQRVATLKKILQCPPFSISPSNKPPPKWLQVAATKIAFINITAVNNRCSNINSSKIFVNGDKNGGEIGGLNQVSHIHWHFLNLSIVEGFYIMKIPVIIGCHKVDGHSLAAKTSTTSNPGKQ